MKPKKATKQFLLILIGLFAFSVSIGQTKVDTVFDYIDKYGVKIKFAKSLPLSHPVDKNFLVENLHSKLLLPQVDNSEDKFEFIVAEIKAKQKNNSYELKVMSYAVSAENRPISSYILRIYEMRLGSENKRFYIKAIDYVGMEY